MSSGFVSGGNAGEEVQRDDEWKRAQQEIEDARRAKAELAKQHDGKSLYEVLQANKDKKQAEFEEKARYKLHVALDDDEADYLDSILEKKRLEEANVKKETTEQLHLFRRQREEAERKARGLEEESAEPTQEHGAEQWAAAGKKRKKGPEVGLLKGVKLRKSSSISEEQKPAEKSQSTKETTQQNTTDISSQTNTKANTTSSAKPPVANVQPSTNASASKTGNPLSLGLGYTSSDDED
ncbi:hypothetical protein COCC4DRAFT_30565 [Bipolaris maydis ATCC 48331]|uniref:FAM192A/Fyv6 N-terminal domain-containing protein n=2 Tax=Cochliobolus heterostrophus TaxID=5016 RepID=M2UTU7_COCH5|nr:uncharacterized protein COCC4DRAFT_30565 [Bipolaris maydis ATCC 48331]EMD91282.1 hypothetical protein COCHEDRAFT_1021373 [Bipolaris maydis C5]KAH7559154.1 hypothetical protein BM1_04091 [Bipolaris maydis]ENI08960.1 hypothetical protein COCC4DRAFT_30565 [Bipolaris maydis ATCC 48331]KAJ5027506.1 N-terminal domain of NEFA-interacting nuclear protein NIP30-domain-containing protein [Bipolaris maydis]KAJ5058705.1 N-terminal domain of NEFA-interacting nuclear protein NIP30-domain-containing prote